MPRDGCGDPSAAFLFQEGVCCIAAPFYRSGGSVAGSVAVSVPAARFAAARESITDAVLRSAERASQIAGHAPGQLEALLP